jgi:hypothetical protein
MGSVMRDGRIITILVWATCSALCAGSMVYLGSNTEPFRSQWPLATGIGAAVGTVAALVVVRARGNRGGLMQPGGIRAWDLTRALYRAS